MIPQIPNTTFTDYQSHEDTSKEGAKRRIPQNRLTVLSGDLWVDPPHESRSKFSRLAGVVQHSCEPISIWSISHLFPILQWSNQNNVRSNITTSLIDQILTKQEIYQLQIIIFLFEIIRTPLCLIRSNRSQAREAQRWSKTGTKKKIHVMHNTHLFKADCAESSRQVHKREAEQCFLIIINNPLYTWYQSKKVFLFTFHRINIWLVDSTKKPPTHFMIKENKAKNPQIIKEGTCKSLPELLTVLGRGRNSGRNSESGHWCWVWSITLRAGDQSTRVTMRIRNDRKGTDTRSSATVQVNYFLEMSGTLSFSL